MNHTKQLKMENPARIAELNPLETLKKIGLSETDAVCDIGAGSGIFTVAASQLTKNKVYALEIDDSMLGIIGEKAKNLNSANIELVKVEGDRLGLDNDTADLVLLVTVFHEIENKAVFLSEIKRLLKRGGRIMAIEFHKRETPLGPPVPHRIAKEEIKKDLENSGFAAADEFDLGDNFYCLTFKKPELDQA